jgi:GH18 family chitinase
MDFGEKVNFKSKQFIINAGAHRSLDYFVMLGYDYDGPWNARTGLSTPLYLPEDNPLCVVSVPQLFFLIWH